MPITRVPPVLSVPSDAPSGVRTALHLLNVVLQTVNDRLDKLEGLRGTPTFNAPPDLQGHALNNVGQPTNGSQAVPRAFMDANTLTFAQGKHTAKGPLDMGTFGVTNVPDPVQSTDAVNKRTMAVQIVNLLSNQQPKPIVPGDAGSPGTGLLAAREDHRHPWPGIIQTYTISNVSTDRAYNAASTTLNELANVLGTLVADLRALGLVH